VDVASAIQTAIVFVWLGMVLGISFLEAPLKFRAPGITVPLGVGIGRLVFRALNRVEIVFALALLVAAAVKPEPWSTPITVWLVVALSAVLVLGAGVLRPLMDRRVTRGAVGEGKPRSRMHLWYVLLECIKVALLIWLGIALLAA